MGRRMESGGGLGLGGGSREGVEDLLRRVAGAFAMNDEEFRAARCEEDRGAVEIDEVWACGEGGALDEGLAGGPGAGEIWLVTGASGSGKSRWLARAVAGWMAESALGDRGDRIVWVDESMIPSGPVVGGFGGRDLCGTLRLLGAMGLTEPSVLFREPCRLSEGQRHRLAMAHGIARLERRMGGVEVERGLMGCLVVDEFGAVLDRVTAAVLSRGVRRLIDADARRRSAVLVTSHDDLVRALDPDVWLVCDFGRISVRRFDRRKRRLRVPVSGVADVRSA